MITYLYHKRHKQTGMNYFGKTIRDPYTYNGSGLYWTAHLRKHGPDIETVKVWMFEDITKCVNFAVNFSNKHNIVKSKTWANLINENGITGGYNPNANSEAARNKKSKKLKGRVFSNKSLLKMSTTKKGLQQGSKNPMYGKTHSEATKELQKIKALHRSRIVCEHCDTECSPNNYKRWHSHNCKLIKQKAAD